MTVTDDQYSILDSYDTGLPDNFEGTITEPEFLFDPEIADGEVPVLRFTLKSLDDDVDDRTESWKCGKGWEVVDGGRGVQREDGRPKNFNVNTKIALAMQSMTEHGTLPRDLAKSRGAMPWDVAFWDGLTFVWRQTSHNYGKIGDATEDVVTNLLLPTTLVTGASSASSKGVAKATSASKPKAKVTKGAKPAAAAVDWLAKMQEIAASDDIPDYTAYENAVMELPGATESDDVINNIESVWAEVVGGE